MIHKPAFIADIQSICAGGFAYIASPYSHAQTPVRVARAQAVGVFTAWLVDQGIVAYIPIVHGHAIEDFCGESLEYQLWIHHGLTMLEKSSALILLKLPGWDASEGIKLELGRRGKRPLFEYEIEPELIPAALKEVLDA